MSGWNAMNVFPVSRKTKRTKIMKNHIPSIYQPSRIMAAVCLTAAMLALSGGAANAEQNDKIIAGESVTVGGGTVSTWARVNSAGKVIWVGLTIRSEERRVGKECRL